MKISPQALHSVVSMCKARPSAAALSQRPGLVAVVAAAALLLAACKDRAPDAPAAASAPGTTAAQPSVAPAALPSPAGAESPATLPASAASAASAASTAPSVSTSALASTASTASTKVPQRVPLQVQGVAAAGVTVRVKAVEMGADATVLDVSISFANRITDTTMLALADTYLQDESGARLHIKRPDNNRDITIREGETLDGQLVFMGAVAPSARKLKLVFNEGNQGDNIVAPGLVVDLPLQGG
ncbi:hypothetical protein [Acidovorax temperans]|uniref:hypothetical protein n=1 Tax=Acidovorax temperans TaxID=80878 RepID=UPI0028A0FC47|nr:hypothetical protein [Acidovorax temperans]